jgi:methylmalonyl-CoA/ethylmalonyl-CoA epimerase
MPGLSQSRIGQIAVVCQDVARASAFYRDRLGLRHLFDAGPTLSFFDLGGVRLMLTTAERAEDAHPGSILYAFGPDIEGTHRDLVAKGALHRDRRGAVRGWSRGCDPGLHRDPHAAEAD